MGKKMGDLSVGVDKESVTYTTQTEYYTAPLTHVHV